MASPFASRVVVTLPVPFDPPNEVTIRKLAGRHLERARNAFLHSLFLDVQARGGATVQKEMQTLFIKDAPNQDEVKAKEAAAASDPLSGLDKYIVVQGGLVDWTYPESCKPEPVTDERGTTEMRIVALDDMDEDAIKWLATEIMRLTKPALFQSHDEAAEARKNA
jgi:hypothetical protein